LLIHYLEHLIDSGGKPAACGGNESYWRKSFGAFLAIRSCCRADYYVLHDARLVRVIGGKRCADILPADAIRKLSEALMAEVKGNSARNWPCLFVDMSVTPSSQ